MNSPIRSERIEKEGTVLFDTIRRLIRRKAVDNLLKLINKTHPADLARVFRHLTPEERQNVFNIVAQTQHVGEVLSELDQSIMVELVGELTPKFMVSVIDKMAADDAADLLEALSGELADEIRQLMAISDRQEVDELLQYDSESAGGLMSPNFLALDEETTVGDAVKSIQEKSEKLEMVFYLYIVREGNHLTGVLSLRELLMHPPYRLLKNIMNPKVIAVSSETDQEEVAHVVSRYNILAVPVVDSSFNLIGIITVDDVIDVIRQEATEDFFQMAGAGKDDEILLKSTMSNALTRAPWLFASCVGGVLAIVVIAYFKAELEKVVTLAAFIPIIVGMGGNIATQSSTIIVRGIATGRINLQEISKVIYKEFRVGTILGTIYGCLIGAVAYFGYPETARLGIVVGISVVFVMILATTVGSIVPLTLKKLNIDAAIATGPFVTTSIDILGVIAFFSIAKYFLGL
nr:magnesium transporter [Desulfobulbaceae bacterium]